MSDYLLLFVVVFGVNLMPAFGPPSWALLVFFKLKYELPLVPLVALGAIAAASGRLLLAHAAQHLRDRLPGAHRADLDALRDVAQRNRTSSIGALALFALSPVPSAQLFIAAGLTGVRLFQLTMAFFAGRLVSYTIYATVASQVASQFRDVIEKGFSSPVSIALQVVMLGLVVALVFVPWKRLLTATPGQNRA